jgi:peptidoglycan biosynthesis protein MviN/MurJ (putative lipid II flippase)
MSPSRSRGQYVPVRPRSEVYVAVAVAAGIVIGTALLIWLMRPNDSGVPGTGGLFTRQPRVTLLVIVTLLAIGSVIWYVLSRRKSWRFGEWGTIAIASGVIVVGAVILGIFWPGGVVRHYTSFPNIPSTPTTTPATTPTTSKPKPTTKPTPTTAATPTTKAR